nr:sulfotransferase family 2 domain-containing protein [Mangrovicoccus sp. HB161399]
MADLPVHPGQHDYRGLFFLHIPKTAGSFVARLFADRLGSDACITFQEREVQHAVSKGGPLSFLGHDFVSAHSPMATLRTAGVPHHYRIFTVLRDPLDRLVSHLNWLDRFNHGIDLHSHAALKRGMKDFVRSLAGLDPDSTADMRRLFTLDSLAKARMLFNIQSAMLFAPRAGDILALTDLDSLTAAQMHKRLSRLAFCATLDQFKQGLAAAGVEIPLDERVNGGKSRHFRRNEALEAAAERYVAQDRKLVQMVARTEPDLSPVLQRLRPGAARPEIRLAAGG